MGLQLPAELTEPLSWIGLDWPQADEELLFAAGQQWLAFGLRLQTAAETGNGAARTVCSRTVARRSTPSRLGGRATTARSHG